MSAVFVLALSGSELFNILTLVNSTVLFFIIPTVLLNITARLYHFRPSFLIGGDAGLKAVINF